MADLSDSKIDNVIADGILRSRTFVQAIPKGVAGTCVYCGEETLRLVGAACAPCREELNLP